MNQGEVLHSDSWGSLDHDVELGGDAMMVPVRLRGRQQLLF